MKILMACYFSIRVSTATRLTLSSGYMQSKYQYTVIPVPTGPSDVILTHICLPVYPFLGGFLTPIFLSVLLELSWQHYIYLAIDDDIMKWKHIAHHWPFVKGIHQSLMYSLHKELLRDVLFAVGFNNLLNNHWGCQWFETPWCLCDIIVLICSCNGIQQHSCVENIMLDIKQNGCGETITLQPYLQQYDCDVITLISPAAPYPAAWLCYNHYSHFPCSPISSSTAVL